MHLSGKTSLGFKVSAETRRYQTSETAMLNALQSSRRLPRAPLVREIG